MQINLNIRIFWNHCKNADLSLFLFKKLKTLDYFLTNNLSFKTKDSKCCKSRCISSPLSLKKHKFCKVSSAFLISVEVGLSIGSSDSSIISKLLSPLVSSSFSERTDSRIFLSYSELSVVITFISTSIISWAVKSWGTNIGWIFDNSVRSFSNSLKGLSLPSAAFTWSLAKIFAFSKQFTL